MFKITINKYTQSKNAVANFNLDLGNGIVINNIELIGIDKGQGYFEFITKTHSYKNKENEWKDITDVFFSKEVQPKIIEEVKKVLDVK